MSSRGGGAVWPRLLLPPPPPGWGEDAGTQDWGPGCSFTPEVVWLLTGPSGHLAVSPGF